jgi:hypothetical protein
VFIFGTDLPSPRGCIRGLFGDSALKKAPNAAAFADPHGVVFQKR